MPKCLEKCYCSQLACFQIKHTDVDEKIKTEKRRVKEEKFNEDKLSNM